jgi:hypothetical protein
MTQKIIRVTDETKRVPTTDEWDIFWNRVPELTRRMKDGSLDPRVVNYSLQKVLEGEGIGAGILKLIRSGIKFPGYPAFRVDDKMGLIKYRGSNFDEWFGGMKVVATPAYELDENELTERAVDTPIIAELGEEKCETSIAVLFWGIETGYWSKDRWYLLYAKDKVGVRRAVSWYWNGDGWRADACRVGHPDAWDVGSHAVSRKHLVV